MRSSLKNSLKYFCFLTLILSACSTQKKLQRLEDTKRKLRPNELILYTQNRNNALNSINAKADCNFTQDDKKTSFNITLKARIDSAIWVSISPALGIEVARAMLTPDSLIVLNKLDKTYFVSGYDALSERLGSDLNFYDLQDLLLYRIIKHQDKDKYFSTDNDSNYVLTKSINRKVKRSLGLQGQNKKDLEIDDINTTIDIDSTKRSGQRRFDKEVQILISTVISKNNLAILNQSVKDVESDQELKIEYGNDFFTDSSVVYPKLVDVTISKQNKLYSKFSLDFNRFRINEPVRFSFNVPDRYEQIAP